MVKVYHMTTKDNWESIQTHGVIERGVSIDDDIKKLGVFVVGDKDSALKWGSWVADNHSPFWERMDEDLVCLEINIPLDLVDSLKPDPVTNDFDPDMPFYEGSEEDWYFADDIPIDWVNRALWVKNFYRHRENGQVMKPTEYENRKLGLMGRTTKQRIFYESWRHVFEYRG